MTTKSKKNISLICARGGSKGLPGKNLMKLGDRSLIGHAINIAKKSPSIQRILISTDCPDIANEAIKYGGEVPFLRRAELASDTASEWSVWKDAVSWIVNNSEVCDALVMLSPTAPLRSLDNVENAIKLFYSTKCDGVISVTDAYRNPYFNMVKTNNDGQASLGISEIRPLHRRQDAPEFYDITTVCYVMRPNYIVESDHMMKGDIRCNHVPKENAIDIDTSYDFMLAEAMMQILKKTRNEIRNDC